MTKLSIDSVTGFYDRIYEDPNLKVFLSNLVIGVGFFIVYLGFTIRTIPSNDR